MPLTRPRAAAAAALVLATAALTSCSAATATSDRAGDGVDVLVGFYPLQYVAEQVGGPHVAVTSLAPPGADSHDVDLSPAQVAAVEEADVVLHLTGMQPATDEAVALRGPRGVLDAARAAGIDLPTGSSGRQEGEVTDPHFWQDPTLLAAVGDAVADQLSETDPDHAGDYAEAADRLADDLTALDREYSAGLAACRGATLVTSHEAFGYLAQRYGLEQVGIAGIDPNVEPSPARLRDVVEVVGDRGVRTLFFETATSTGVAQVLAEDLGVGTGVLDPVERVPAEGDYLTAMRANLESLREGLVCSG